LFRNLSRNCVRTWSRNFAPKTKGHSPQAMPFSNHQNFLLPVLRRELQPSINGIEPLKYLNKFDPTAKRGNYMQTLRTIFCDPRKPFR
jgi:hypothetical protein